MKSDLAIDMNEGSLQATQMLVNIFVTEYTRSSSDAPVNSQKIT